MSTKKTIPTAAAYVPNDASLQRLATIHPSSLLRAPDEIARRVGMERFVEDLVEARKALTE